jgi:hypothetical protein
VPRRLRSGVQTNDEAARFTADAVFGDRALYRFVGSRIARARCLASDRIAGLDLKLLKGRRQRSLRWTVPRSSMLSLTSPRHTSTIPIRDVASMP